MQGKNVQKESIAVYTPDRWLVGQLPTKSNICGRKWNQTRFFNDAKNADHSDAPFFAVLGPHRSGTSCVAMVMHHLGVHMGNQLGGYEATGGGEAIGLAQLCEKAMRFPAVDPNDQRRTTDSETQVAGSSLANPKPTATRRSPAASIRTSVASLITFTPASAIHCESSPSIDPSKRRSVRCRTRSRKTSWPMVRGRRRGVRRLATQLSATTENGSSPRIPTFPCSSDRVRRADRRHPEEVIASLIEFLGIEPTEEEIESAIDHVNPELKIHG